MKVTLKNQAGFSLVELMVVVAIIGILAAIAIPNFQRFTAKSKQAEATSNLAVLYSAEKAFIAEWSIYVTPFEYIGYAPTGYMRYQHGFATASTVTPSGSWTAPTGGSDSSTATYCAQGGSTMTNGCNVITVPVAPSGVPASSVVTGATNTFTAAAVAYIGNSGTQDQWTINESKQLINIANGLP